MAQGDNKSWNFLANTVWTLPDVRGCMDTSLLKGNDGEKIYLWSSMQTQSTWKHKMCISSKHEKTNQMRLFRFMFLSYEDKYYYNNNIELINKNQMGYISYQHELLLPNEIWLIRYLFLPFYCPCFLHVCLLSRDTRHKSQIVFDSLAGKQRRKPSNGGFFQPNAFSLLLSKQIIQRWKIDQWRQFTYCDS